MTDDPNAAYVPAGKNHPTMTVHTDTITSETVRAALIELLTLGQHHHAATHTTLTAIGDTRRTLAPSADDNQRLAALSQALATVGGALITVPHPRHPDTTGLREGLTEMAAITLGWLDTLPEPHDQPH